MSNQISASMKDKVTEFFDSIFGEKVIYTSATRKPYKKHERCLEDAVFYWENYKARVRLFRKSADSTPVLLVTYRWGNVHDFLNDILRVAKHEFNLDGVTVVTHMPHWKDPMRSMFNESRFCLAEMGDIIAFRDLSQREFQDLSGVAYFEVYDDDEPLRSFITEEREFRLKSNLSRGAD